MSSLDSLTTTGLRGRRIIVLAASFFMGLRALPAQAPAPCVATNRRTVRPNPAGDTGTTAAHPFGGFVFQSEPCDDGARGYYLAPSALLDWSSTDAPPFKFLITGYDPHASSASSILDPARVAWGAQPTVKDYDATLLGHIGAPGPPFDLTLGANEGRLREDLREAAQRADPEDDLCRAAYAFLLNHPVDGNALADLSVTGRRAYAAFVAQPPKPAAILSCLQTVKSSHWIAGVAIATEAMREQAVNAALDRAYGVLHVVRAGGWPDSCSQRAELGYIAVSGEDDQPHRPVNVPTPPFPQYDLDVSVPRPDGQPPLIVHTRYIIAHTVTPPGAELASCREGGRTIPTDRAPVLAADAEVILYIHGMDSSLEEALDLAKELRVLGQSQHRNFTVVSMDLPTSGYADKVAPGSVAPLSAEGRAPGRDLNLMDGLTYAPNGYAAPLVDFDENFVVAFVNTLSERIPLAQQIRGVVGGSLGGNLAMRLGRPRPDAPWVTHVVPWSPAAVWPSFADDPLKHPALAASWYLAGGDPAFTEETPGARRSFFYGAFDWQSKVFGIAVGGGRAQAEFWYRDGWPCKYARIRLARIARYEIYNQDFRAWHWRLALEQLQFSHESPKAGSAQPLYLFNTTPMLLMCGLDDTGGDLCRWTQEVAAKMVNTPGQALFLATTGHSIHNERPRFLAREIVDFLWPSSAVALSDSVRSSPSGPPRSTPTGSRVWETPPPVPFLTQNDLAAYERGVGAEIELVARAQAALTAATTSDDSLNALDSARSDALLRAGAQSASVTVERYRKIWEAVNELLAAREFSRFTSEPSRGDTANLPQAIRRQASEGAAQLRSDARDAEERSHRWLTEPAIPVFEHRAATLDALRLQLAGALMILGK